MHQKSLVIRQISNSIINLKSTNFPQEVLDIAENKTTINSQVIAIDMFTGFGDNFLADDVHYNENGAEFIANKYYNTLANLLD